MAVAFQYSIRYLQMQNKIAKTFKLAAIGLIFLFGLTTAQAAIMPTPDHSFGTLVSGTHSASTFLPDTDPNVRWFEFALSATSFVDLDTLGSFADTVLALYNDGGTLIGQNDDCPSLPTLTSCLTFASLGIGTYLAGVTNFPGIFFDDWILLASDAGDEDITLNVTVSPLSPVPATLWLFGTALVGLVGFGKRKASTAV